MKDLIFITGNQNKADYLAKWLGVSIPHQKVDLDEIQSLDLGEVVEHKARQAYNIVHKPVLVEDVSLSFTAMGRLPGTFIKWFEEPGITALCRMLDGFVDRSAQAKVLYGLFDGRRLQVFEGKMSGQITSEPRGGGGFGFDSIFVNDGQTQTRAEMDETTYATTSYRTQAIKKLKAFLETT